MNVPIELDTCLKMATASVFTLRSERDQAMAEGLRDRRELSSMRAERDAFKAKVDAATALAAKWKREWDGSLTRAAKAQSDVSRSSFRT